MKKWSSGKVIKTWDDFEKTFALSLDDIFKENGNYEVVWTRVFYRGEEVALLMEKHELYNEFFKPLGIDWKLVLSRKLLPDKAVYVKSTRTLYIVEAKYQERTWSTDEKLQTCDFKKKQYLKLTKLANVNLEYGYFLSDWFKDIRYYDVLNYIQSVGCFFHFTKIPLSFFNLPQ